MVFKRTASTMSYTEKPQGKWSSTECKFMAVYIYNCTMKNSKCRKTIIL